MKNHQFKTVCVVTGGAQGIGFYICRTLVQQGFTVFMVDADPEALDDAAEEAGSPDIIPWQADAGKESQIQSLFACIASEGYTLYGIVNNAGISRNMKVTELSLEDWHAVIDTNLTSIFLTAKYGSPLMEIGSIVNIASTRALMSEPDTEAYSASKGGVLSLTHSLAVSLGPKIRVNAVSPGWIDVSWVKKKSRRKQEVLSSEDHSQHPAGRVGRPEDIASMAAYLLSPAAGFISGENIVIDGGMTRNMIYV